MANNEELERLKNELLLPVGLGHYPIDSTEVPSHGMTKDEARKVLKLLNAGCETVNFTLELDEAKKFRRPAEPAFAVQLTEGDFSLSMTFDTDPDFTWYEGDKISFMLRKRDDPDFKFRARVIYFIRRCNMIHFYEDFPETNMPLQNDIKDSRNWADGWQTVTYTEIGYRCLEGAETYFARLNITVL